MHVGVCLCIIGDCQAPTLRKPHWWWGLVSLYYAVILSWGETAKYKEVAPQIGRTCYCSWPGHFSHVMLFPTEVVRDFGSQCMWLLMFNSLSGEMVGGFVFRFNILNIKSHVMSNKRSVHSSLRLLSLQCSAL